MFLSSENRAHQQPALKYYFFPHCALRTLSLSLSLHLSRFTFEEVLCYLLETVKRE